jgi:hypothetical protein
MAESFNLLRRVKSLDTSPELPVYTGVVIYAGQDEEGNNIEYSAGDRTGTVLEITNDWGSQAQADAIYEKIRGFRYQPYSASGTTIDPSVEIGDAVTIAGTYGGVFLRATDYRDTTSSLEAPSNEEIEHEFQVQSPTNRQYERFTRTVRADLTLKATQIKAKVERKEGDETSDFWWDLQADGWAVGTKESKIFGVDKDGAYVNGEIRATSGTIGGYTIKNGCLCTNGQTWGGTNSKGIYLGPEGIQCGKSFKVDMSGNLEATSGKFGSLTINTKTQQVSGNYYGNLGGCGGSVSGLSGSVSGITGSLSTGINVGEVGIGTYVGDIVAGKITADLINARMTSTKVLLLDNKRYGDLAIRYTRPDGSSSLVHVLATQD